MKSKQVIPLIIALTAVGITFKILLSSISTGILWKIVGSSIGFFIFLILLIALLLTIRKNKETDKLN